MTQTGAFIGNTSVAGSSLIHGCSQSPGTSDFLGADTESPQCGAQHTAGASQRVSAGTRFGTAYTDCISQRCHHYLSHSSGSFYLLALSLPAPLSSLEAWRAPPFAFANKIYGSDIK